MSPCYKYFSSFDSFYRLLYVRHGLGKFTRNLFKKRDFRKFNSCSYSKGTVSPGLNQCINFVKFEDMVQAKRKQAQKSYVVQVSSENSCAELYEYCHRIAPIRSMFYYAVNSFHFVLIEFEDSDSAKLLCSHNAQGHSVESPFLWFKAVKDKKAILTNRQELPHIPIKIWTPAPAKEEINDLFSACESLTQEMDVLFESMKLSDFGFRLRMICARQLEMALTGLFPNVQALPFGSTVNSFGKDDCDLDVVLRYGSSGGKELDTRLIYHSKSGGSVSRGQTQRQMELIGDILQLFAPGVVGVKRILGARVPIIKYSHEFSGIDIDISLTNLSGFYMSELLYLFGTLDPAAQKLVFTIKTWAKTVGLTSHVPGRWITNFSLTLMTLFYLQMEKRLPSVDALIGVSREEDKRYADDINCTFIRDLQRFNTNLDLSVSQEDLLKGFFSYYQGFDFENKSINLCKAEVGSKPDFSPLYIVNPLERSLNVSKNVSLDEIERFRMEARNAAWVVDTKGRLKDLFDRAPYSHTGKKYVTRLVAVRDLFS